jgi:tetratricopeptide (TPR) repeat protein
MRLKDQLIQILEKSRAAELEFLANLTDEEKAKEGTYEKWSAKDAVAHANYWEEVRATRNLSWTQGEELELLPPYDQANAESYERFSKSTWDEVETFAERAHASMVETVRALDEDSLAGPSEESEERKMWESIVGISYTHKLVHYAEIYSDRGQRREAGHLWSEWAALVSPLDAAPEWQGGVHYNAACGLALAGDHDAALEALQMGLELRPSLKAWSRRDTDLEILHNLPAYKDLFAPAYWWEALKANPSAEALADQFMRALSMFRNAVNTFPEETWLEGDTLYQRPAGLALHIVQTVDFYSTLKPGERTDEDLARVNWQDRDASKLPSQEELLRFLESVEERLANFITKSDLEANEDIFPWTGFTILSRALYSLRHIQHHLADMAMELQHRGLRPPGWQ